MRRATEKDAPAIAALHIASWRATYRAELPAAFLASQDLADRTRLWRERLARPGMRVLLVEEAGQLLGFCACRFAELAAGSPAPWEILNLHIDPGHQGRGLGSRLFDAAAELGRGQGARELVLWVVATNATARGFYERKGMRPDGGRQVHDIGDGGSLEEVRYRMAL